jgi:hypothetical protein
VARVETIRLVSDLDGGDADETVEFAIDGKTYVIDLSTVQAADLRTKFALYAASARRLRSSKPATSSSSRNPKSAESREQNAAIRAWARDNGYGDLGDRGRIPVRVLDAYRARAAA